MDFIDEIQVHNDENKPVRTAVSVTASRAKHYADVIEHLTGAAIAKYIKDNNKNPTKDQIELFQSDLVRLTIIKRDMISAIKLQIPEV